MRRALASLIPIASFGLLAARLTGGGESPPEARRPPALRYLLRVRSSDLSGFDVRLRIRGAPAAFDLAMFAHPEYDARFWRYLEGLEASSPGGPGRIVREENALWRVTGCSGDCSVRYRIRLPPETGPARAAYRPFLAETGGLVGGPDAFLYLVGAEKAPARLRLGLPPGWDAATGLDRGGRPNEFTAASAEALLDSPILIGRCRTWRFSAGGVPHIVAYWPLPDAAAFDAGAFVDGVARVAREAIRIFGGAPYRHYTFLYQDGAFGALEHADSVTIGAPSHELARNPRWHLPVTAHEFFHTWNLVRTRPVERVGIGYRPPEPTRELWWSEGVTMYYADLLMLRAGLPAPDGATRTEHLENLLARYLVNAGNARISPERASAALGGPPGAFGDETADVYLQGRLIGAALDLVLRDATDGRRSLDDVLRAMNRRFFGARGFGGRDLQRTAEEVCGCDLEAFFDRFVRGGNALDFDGALALIGLRARVWRGPALGPDGQAAPDLRIFAWLPEGEGDLRLALSTPESVWGRAGFHTGDRIVGFNGVHPGSVAEFRAQLDRICPGDAVDLEVERDSGFFGAVVSVPVLERPYVRIEEVPEATQRQRRLRSAWLESR